MADSYYLERRWLPLADTAPWAKVLLLDVGDDRHCPATAEMPSDATRVTGPNTAVITDAPGTLVRLVFNTLGVSSTLSLYDHDSASGLPTAVFALLQGLSLRPPQTEFNWRFGTGLVASVPSGMDVTLLWRPGG